MLNKFILGAGVLLAASSAMANFTVEGDVSLGFGYAEAEVDSNRSSYSADAEIDTSTRALKGQAYFGRVTTADVPFREAGFLSKLSSVYLDVSRRKTETEYDDDYDSEYEVKTKRLGIRGVIPGPNLILGGFKGTEDFDGTDFDLLGVSIGFYIGDGGALTFEYSTREYEESYYDYFDGYVDDESSEKSVVVNYKQVSSMGERNHFAFWGQIGIDRYDSEYDGDSNDGNGYTIEGGITWYKGQKLGFGASILYMYQDSDSGEVLLSKFSPALTYDFVENVGLKVQLTSMYQLAEYDFADIETTGIELSAGLTVRF